MAAEALVLHRQWIRAGFLIPVWTNPFPKYNCSKQQPSAVQKLHTVCKPLDGRYPDALPNGFNCCWRPSRYCPAKPCQLCCNAVPKIPPCGIP